MAAGKISIQANDGKVAGIVFEDGAAGNVDLTIPKDGGKLAADSIVVHKTGDEAIAGVKTFSSSPIVPVPTSVNQVISMGNIIEKTGAGLGYGTGSGGTVTQLTSKSTAVTLNKHCGQITMHNASLAAGESVFFPVNNNLVSVLDHVILTIGGPTTNTNYTVFPTFSISNGVFYIIVKNISAESLSEALVINFAIIKGAIN